MSFLDKQWPKAVAIRSTKGVPYVAGYKPTSEPCHDDGRWDIHWTEGGHRRSALFCRVVASTPTRLEVEDFEGDHFVFEALTLEIYNARIRDRTVGKPRFATLEELLEAMAFDW